MEIDVYRVKLIIDYILCHEQLFYCCGQMMEKAGMGYRCVARVFPSSVTGGKFAYQQSLLFNGSLYVEGVERIMTTKSA